MKAEGKVWRYGDNVDTDVIIPARYLNSFDPKELASHCMVDIDETFAKEVKAGDIILSGGAPRYVLSADKGTVTAINFEDAVVETMLPEHHLLV